MSIYEVFSVGTSAAALAIALMTFWLTHLRVGNVKMTTPTQIYFHPAGRGGTPQIYVAALLYTDSYKGRAIENMFVRLKRGQSTQTFSVWVYGEKELTRAKGLLVSREGKALNHHFLLAPDAKSFEFSSGKYQLQIFGRQVGDHHDSRLFETELHLSESEASKMAKTGDGVFFEWGPDTGSYHSHVKPSQEKIEAFKKVVDGIIERNLSQ